MKYNKMISAGDEEVSRCANDVYLAGIITFNTTCLEQKHIQLPSGKAFLNIGLQLSVSIPNPLKE